MSAPRLGGVAGSDVAMDTRSGIWSPEDRQDGAEPTVLADALAPDRVARLIAWIVSAPPVVVVKEVTVTPLLEQEWP